MFHECFQRAIDPKPCFRVLRVPLKPLTLGHLFLLRERVPGIFSPDGFGFEEFQLAVFICGHSTALEAKKALSRNRIVASIVGAYWGFRCRSLLQKMGSEMERFCRFMDFERQLPPMREPDKEERCEVRVPDEWSLVEFLMSTYSMPPDEALNLPLRSVNALWIVHMAAAGRIDLATTQGRVGSAVHQAWVMAHPMTETKTEVQA